jgi:hypothetical protein
MVFVGKYPEEGFRRRTPLGWWGSFRGESVGRMTCEGAVVLRRP